MAVHCGLRQWPAVRAWLSTAPVPVASLHLAAADGRAAQQLSQLLCSPHFQQVCAPPTPTPPTPVSFVAPCRKPLRSEYCPKTVGDGYARQARNLTIRSLTDGGCSLQSRKALVCH